MAEDIGKGPKLLPLVPIPQRRSSGKKNREISRPGNGHAEIRGKADSQGSRCQHSVVFCFNDIFDFGRAGPSLHVNFETMGLTQCLTFAFAKSETYSRFCLQSRPQFSGLTRIMITFWVSDTWVFWVSRCLCTALAEGKLCRRV